MGDRTKERDEMTRQMGLEKLHRMNTILLERHDYAALRIGQTAFECLFHDVEGSSTEGMTYEEFVAYKSTPYGEVQRMINE